MAITYVNDLRLSEMGTGDNSGTWGTVTNTNLELIGEALGFGTEAITTNADTHASTIADGSTDPVRAMYVKYTGTLDSACTITIGPNTVNKFYYIENATSGSQNIIISQGSGANVTIPAGDVKAVYLDGAGSGAAVVDAFASLNVVDLKVQDDLTVTDDMTIGGTLGVTGVLTATAGFASTDASTIIAADGAADNQFSLIIKNEEATDDRSYGLYIQAGSTVTDSPLHLYEHTGSTQLFRVSGTGQALFTDGSASFPSITNIGDTNTGIFFPAADTIAFAEGGVERVTINGNGSVGIGVADGDVTSDGTAARTYVGIIGTGNRGRLNIGSTAVNGADSGVISFVNGANELGNINMETNSGSQTVGKMYISSTDLLTINSAGGVVFNDNSANVDFRVESNGNANMLFVDGGNDAVVVGASAADTTISGGTPAFQVIGTGVGASVASTRRENNAFGAALIMSKSRNTTPDNYTVVQAGDTLGSIIFIGDDGTNLDTYGATISNVVKSGVGENDMPTELIFSTNSGTTTVAERMKIQHNSGNNVVVADGLTLTDGNLIIGGAGHGIDFGATGQGAGSPTSEILADYEEGTFTPVLRDAIAGTAAGASATSGRYTRVGRIVNISFAMSINSVSGMTGTNALNLTGLPYSVNNDSAGGGEPHAQILSFISPLVSADYGGSIILRPNNNTASCELKYTSGGSQTSQGAQSLQVQNLGSNPFLCGSATYEVLAGT